MVEENTIFQSTEKEEIISYINYLDMIMIMMEKRDKSCVDLMEEKKLLQEKLKKLENK